MHISHNAPYLLLRILHNLCFSFPTSFPGFSPTRPTERERESERPWKTLVTYLPESLSLHRVWWKRRPLGTRLGMKNRVLQLSQEELKTMLMQNFWGANKVHYGRCASGVCIKIKVPLGCPVVACPRATVTEYLITYIRTVWQTQPFDSRLRVRLSREQSSNFPLRLRTHEKGCF